MTRVAVWIGGAPPVEAATSSLPPFDLILAADSGLDAAVDAGVSVDVLVGDLDSVTNERMSSFAGEVVRFPVDKDFTDLELALDTALERGATHVVVIGGGGGRLDHELASLLVLTLNKYATFVCEARLGKALVRVVRDSADFVGQAGEVLSLLPLTDQVDGVTTQGLRWPLQAATLERGATWSVSNEFVGSAASVSVTSGVLLAVQPAAFGERAL